MASSSANVNKIKSTLDELRAGTTTNVPDEVLQLIWDYLIGSPSITGKPHNIHEHWLCSRADALAIECATFLFRLHAYESGRVKTWKEHLRACLARCCDCVRTWEEKRIESKQTYLGAFPEQVLQRFFKVADAWEVQRVLDSLAEVHISPDSTNNGKTLDDAPPPVVYQIFSNPRILADPCILRLVHSRLPRGTISGWPTDAPPPGLLLLLVDEVADVRTWAERQVALYKTAPMPKESFVSAYVTVLTMITQATAEESLPFAHGDQALVIPLSREADTLWHAYCTILRYVPPAFYTRERSLLFDIRHLVINHLHDTGTHFVHVLKCFMLLLARIGPDVWKGDIPHDPQVVFSAIKDNPRYLGVLQDIETARREDWQLNWLETFLKSIGTSILLRDVLPSVIQFLCEELQHERFQGVRPAAMTIAARIVLAMYSQYSKEPSTLELASVRTIVGIHTGLFVSVSFAKAYAGKKWEEARNSARKVIRATLMRNIKDVFSAISELCGLSKDSTISTSLAICEQMWKGMYDSLQPDDTAGITMALSIIACVAHVDELKESAFSSIISRNEHPEAALATLHDVNNALRTMSRGFADAIGRVVDFTPPDVAAELFQTSEAVRSAMTLMLSPVESLQEPAQSLVGLVFEVEIRVDCLHSLLERFPGPAMAGIVDFLKTYVQYADVVPEACNLSKAIARCMTDVIDVLCSGPEGLLRKESYLKSGVGATLPDLLSDWWGQMTQVLSSIFSKTPKWANYFESADMVLWMRDALIFGRDLLAQRRIIESGILARSPQARPGKLSRAGRRMVDNLQPVLLELARWLRLTDEELLHQSFSLLESLLACFEETGIRPSQGALQKLQKHVDDARKKDPKRPQTRLDASRIARLEEGISAFDEDDEIQIVSHRQPEGKTPTVTRTTESVAAKGKAPAPKAAKPKPALNAQATRPSGPRRQSSSSAASSHFTAEDQRKLELDSALPRFSASKRYTQPSGHVRPAPFNVDTLPSDVQSDAASSATGPADSSSEESDGEESGLAALSKMQKTPKIRKPAERRQVVLIDMPVNRPNAVLDRARKREDARRTQMRLKPDISSLHRTLLSWNYDHQSPDPPGERLNFLKVPPRFSDAQHFRRVFEPMLLHECWTQLVESKEDPALEKYECRVSSRQFADDWLDLDVSITGSVREWSLSDADMVLLRHPSTKKSILAKTQSFRSSYIGVQATLRCLARNDVGLQINTAWEVSKVLSLTTLHREYAALLSMPYYDHCDGILQARVSKPGSVDLREMQKAMSDYKVNEPQAKAILNALSAEGFSLIQGPPGTGKTSTICGLVHAFISRRPKPATAIHAGRSSGAADREPVKKILMCAPSNAAINEVANRLKEGISGAGYRAVSPNVVRLGANSTMSASVKEVSLEYLIDQKMNTGPESQSNLRDAGTELARLRTDLDSVKRIRQEKFDEMSSIRDNSARTFALEEEIKKLNKQKASLIHEIDKTKDKQKSDHRTFDATRRRFRTEVLLEADIICCTLSGAAYEYLEALDFDLIIIDEAAQAIELSTLIPLKYSCGRCIMVGDPQQLPPTVKSQQACTFGYNQSLFVRLQAQHPESINLLSIQYRMHPDISQLPSKLFYDGRLQDGPDMAGKTARPWHAHSKFGSYRFFNVARGQEESGSGAGHSLLNRTECQVAVALYNRLIRDCSSFDFDFKIGVISMYRGQIGELRRAFEQRFGKDITRLVDFNTVDGFQGQEKDVIILSCVRAGPGVQSVGFLRDIRRMNVALTRAKSSLFVLGNTATLERSDDVWRSIVHDAKARECLVDADVSYFTSPAGAAVTKAPSSAKAVKTEHKAERAALPTLLTPRDMKELAARPPVPELARMEVDEALDTKPQDTAEVKIGQKRLADDSEDFPVEPPSGPTTSKAVGAPNPKPRPKPPPTKRPKQGPSLFIPKKRP